MKLKRVVVTGLGALTPIGNSVEAFSKALKEGKSGAGPITKFNTENFKTKFACEVKNFDVHDFIDKKEARKLDPVSQFAMVASDEALAQSGILDSNVDRKNIGVVWGSGIGGIKSFEEEVVSYTKGNGTPRFSPFFIVKMIIDIIPGHISIKHGFMGPNYSTVSACATSGNAIADAFNLIRLGKADAIVCGGSEAAITESGIGGFNASKALSTRNDDPATASRPYDAGRDGFVMGEGAAALILEDYEIAKRRGANIIAEVKGTGLSADAYHMTAPHPDGVGVELVMHRALSDAEMKMEEIDYINTHGTSTPLGDLAELAAISKVLGDKIYDISISSTKSMTGHLLGAAGAVESVACILAIQEGFIPPTINNINRDENIDDRIDLTLNTPNYKKIKTAMNNTFGFGGHNTSLIFSALEE